MELQSTLCWGIFSVGYPVGYHKHYIMAAYYAGMDEPYCNTLAFRCQLWSYGITAEQSMWFIWFSEFIQIIQSSKTLARQPPL